MPFLRRRNRHLLQRLAKIDAMPPRAGYRANDRQAISTFLTSHRLTASSGDACFYINMVLSKW